MSGINYLSEAYLRSPASSLSPRQRHMPTDDAIPRGGSTFFPSVRPSVRPPRRALKEAEFAFLLWRNHVYIYTHIHVPVDDFYADFLCPRKPYCTVNQFFSASEGACCHYVEKSTSSSDGDGAKVETSRICGAKKKESDFVVLCSVLSPGVPGDRCAAASRKRNGKVNATVGRTVRCCEVEGADGTSRRQKRREKIKDIT